ncbi:pentapeptide repeat-containing protein [Pseudanabaena yagii]|uniref:Pentapeptide repeat-containing protein n=1 Tax=Pseudanabaena yagii GIHE-NHR1 TaxID=2722753 RepID=A0ABX1LS52_9CYAN|nr:pentapeptide repeat-containing protein [Pseudanabaena yagii]NMF58982.1 pentapeptide repeat-containing protein [Pseudanabaena yagii GIHE-NHR1]
MTEITNSNQATPEAQPAKPVRTLEALLELYQQGHRNFSGSDLRGVTVDIVDKETKYLDLRGVILTGSNLTAIVFSKSTSTFKVDLTGSIFKDCNLRLANLSYCRLDQCNFNNTDLSGANLSNSSFRKHLRIDSSKIFKHFSDQSYINKRL